jgi:2,4-dienoyl-CoA reductase-like NADH-dependent reductase (Old Yellow Enzyme family)
MIFEPFRIKGVELKNRILRSSIGGKMSYYNGSPSAAWQRFETLFAERGVAGIISTTISVDDRRWAPLQYPKISDDRFIAPFRAGVRAVQAHDCRYIMQIGDGGYHAQMSLLPKIEDSKTASPLFDLIYGYTNRATAMTEEEIAHAVQNFAAGARRAREAGCDGIEIAAHKGYLIHQFLNPGINRRTDAYGGSFENRFRLLREIVEAVRKAVGADYLIGVRLAATDRNYLPINLRLPVVFPLRHYLFGNTLTETLEYGRKLAKLGVDYLHITNGFGFINPGESPGAWPVDEYRLYANATRHLSAKAKFRAILLNTLPRAVLTAIFGISWRYQPAANVDHARAFKEATGLPIIANGGFELKDQIDSALQSKTCDLIAMARPLLANPDLLELYRRGVNAPERPCSHCNRCSIVTAVLPLGCYDRTRFDSQRAMEDQILWWSGGPTGEEPASHSQTPVK